MKMMKKAICLTLCAAIAAMMNTLGSVGAFAANKVASSNSVCPGEELNKAGQFIDLDCAIRQGIQSSLGGREKVTLNNIGKKLEYKLYFWDYTTLSNFAKTFGGDLTAAKNGLAYQNILAATEQSIGKLFVTSKELTEEIAKQWLLHSKYISGDLKTILSDLNDEIRESYTKSTATTVVTGAVGALATGILIFIFPPAGLAVGGKILASGVGGALAGVVSGGLSSSIHAELRASNQLKKIETFQIGVDNYISAINQLLTHVKNKAWVEKDLIFISINSHPKDHDAFVSLKQIGKKYTKIENDNFAKNFETLEKELTAIQNKHNAEGGQ